MVERSWVILLSHKGLAVENIAERLQTRAARVSKWRQRFAKDRLAGLSDAPRSGASRTSIRMKPSGASWKRSIRRRRTAMRNGTVRCWHKQWGDVSEHHVWRILRRRGIQLQRRRGWCITTDPEFGPKAADVAELYLSPPEKAHVICVDEKPYYRPCSGHNVA
jgi:transposase